jgi:outer membrane immunogenic protein
MKKFALSVAALALTAGAALAADLPSRKGPPVLPPPPPPPPLWTGFYAGLNAGYGFGTNSNTQSIGLGSQDFTGFGYPRDTKDVVLLARDQRDYLWSGNSTLGAGLALSGVGNNSEQHGFIGGGQVGYNYQWGPSFVIGLEADIQGTGIRGTSRTVGLGSDSTTVGYDRYHRYSADSTAFGATNVNAGVDWLGTVRGRVGYLFTPTLLAYVTGGLTYGGVYANVNNYGVSSTTINAYHYDGKLDERDSGFGFSHTFIGGGNKSQTLVGWNVGGGLEWLLSPNWSVKAEAIYWNMGNQTLPTVGVAAAPESAFVGGGRERSLSDSRGSGPSASPAVVYGATRVNYQGVIARAGINYHFNWFAPAPVVAKY